MRKFLILVLVLFPVLLVQGQQRLLSIMDQQDLTLDQQVDSVIVEFGLDVKEQELSRLLGMLGRLGGKTRCVVEMCPYNREKNLCGTARMYTTEALAATLGYVVLIPDNLGYGKTSHLPIPYQMSENSARVSADLRLAAEEYFEQTLKRKLPSNAWMDACINVANVFRDRVLEDFDRIASGLENARKLVEEYGSGALFPGEKRDAL